jgi:hypothetical protein
LSGIKGKVFSVFDSGGFGIIGGGGGKRKIILRFFVLDVLLFVLDVLDSLLFVFFLNLFALATRIAFFLFECDEELVELEELVEVEELVKLEELVELVKVEELIVSS